MFSEAAVPSEAAKPESLNQNPHTSPYSPIQPHTAPIQPYTAPYSPIHPYTALYPPPYIPQQRKLKRNKKIIFFCERNNFFHKADVIVT